MSSNLFQRAEKDGIRLSIYQDDDCSSPREDDNIGTMVCWHRRYTLGDKHNYSDVDDWIRSLAEELDIETEVEDSDGYSDYRPSSEIYEDIEKKCLILPLYLYDHSGLRMSTGSFGDPWDSGQVGYIYCTHDKIKKEYGEVNDKTIERARLYMLDEVKTYDQYLSGDVYGFMLEKKNKCECCGHVEYEDIESCWGFYGQDWKENGMAEYIPQEYHYLIDLLQ